MMNITLYIRILITIALMGGLFRCSYIQKRIDIYSLKDIAEEILNNFNPGDPEELRSFLDKATLEKSTQPIHGKEIRISMLDKWHVHHPKGYKIISERLTFPSRIKYEQEADKAVFYIYRRGELTGRNVILWVPGMGVSDFAFRFIKDFFKEELSRDYDIVFYNIPYHLERIEEGKKNSEGFLSSSTLKNVDLILNSVSELRTVIEYLNKKGVRSIGGWGGSIGATMLLLTSHLTQIDHLCIMIPILNLESVACNRDYMKKVIDRLISRGFDKPLIKRAYGLVNPINYTINVKPSRIQILFAEYDQLTPKSVTIDFAKKNDIRNVISYPRSHATILLTGKVSRDYGKFLDRIKHEDRKR